ncbi:uncharacterized protein LOC116294190 [Actinia tenebrosa]|uniref:Uncharacterized protein LOC116294190 n=1 Tax=Actinia tenebrosa TaxID=6105 RepID=A0A6P8HY52_ACTTE|nr:uncharacterized protein LOC116294190 [Actinia tenebrosa]
MDACVLHEIMHNRTTFNFLVRAMGNCTCMEYMRGECAAMEMQEKAENPHANGFNVHWILFLIVTMVMMILIIFILGIWQKIQEKLAARPRVVYNKELQRIQMTNLPTNDVDDFDDDDDDSNIYNPPSGYENPVYLASVSRLPHSNSGVPHSISGISLSTSGYVNSGSKPGYTPVNGKSSQDVATDNSNESHQFVNPVYFSPEI